MSDSRYLPELQLSPDQHFYRGKVRDVYHIGDQLISIASDRISAFDHILPRAIPYKGQVLNLLADHFMSQVEDIVPVWRQAIPCPNVSVGHYATPIKIEMVIRGYLAGHAWRSYQLPGRRLCGIQLPEGLREADRLPSPIITPATKAEEGHDEDISYEEILERSIVDKTTLDRLYDLTRQLFERGTTLAREVGLILVDTKYEFGMVDGELILIDEIHTPDSSRYYDAEGYKERQAEGIKQQQLSKEFVREWLMTNGFQGLEGHVMPDMPDAFIEEVSQKYIGLYERLTGKVFQEVPPPDEDTLVRDIRRVLTT